jgi:pectinesterase
LVLLDCSIVADSLVQKLYLGRPWRAYAKTVLVRCSLPAAIVPEGWHNWSNPENEKTVLYAEYESTGPGANTAARAGWSKQLTKKEAGEYTLQKIFADHPDMPAVDPRWYAQPSISFTWTVK